MQRIPAESPAAESIAVEEVVVACIQQRLRIYATLDDYRVDLQRFLRIAQHKHAQLVVFPELAGIMLAPPLLHNHRITMLKYADLSTRRRASWQQRTVGRMAKWGATFLQLNVFDEVAHWPDLVDAWPHYCKLFGGLAREFGITLVAPSTYLPDPADRVLRNIAGVFGENGDLLGYQAKVMLHGQDQAFVQPGSDWPVIPTRVGKLGLMLGHDVLLPEVGRLLAYKGAEILIAQGACRDMALYHKMRASILAHTQENQLFAAASFLVGHALSNPQAENPFVGKSAILAPQTLTPRFNGVLVEMGNPRSEGVLSTNWNFAPLKALWAMSDSPLRKQLSFQQIGAAVAALYASLQAISIVNLVAPLPANREQDEAKTQLLPAREPVLQLDDLLINNTVTRRWPLAKLDYTSFVRIQETPDMPPLLQTPLAQPTHQTGNVANTNQENHPTLSNAEDETEEMDALPGDVEES